MLSNFQPNGPETFKKISYSRRQRGGHIKRWWVDYRIYATPYLPVGRSTDRKVTGSQKLTYKSESSEPHIKLPCLGIWHWEKEPLEHLALKARGLVHRSSMGLGEMETPFLKGTPRLSHALGPRAKQSLYSNLGQTWLQFLEDLLGKQGWMWLIVGEGHWKQSSQECSSAAAFLCKWPFWENLAPHISAEKPQAKQHSFGSPSHSNQGKK